jgi:UDP-2,3-diacylglucosamine pyrophosphatase LpxH
MREIDGILYCNDGDWVESHTALVEHMDGRLELLQWPVLCRALSTAPIVEVAT